NNDGPTRCTAFDNANNIRGCWMPTPPIQEQLNLSNIDRTRRQKQPSNNDGPMRCSIGSSSSTHNVAFVSSDNTNSTNEVNTAFGVATSSGHNSQKKGSSSYTDDLMYSFFTNQYSGLQLDHEDLE
nr:hypothetical protein [Tanacetum cinerariifolium]